MECCKLNVRFFQQPHSSKELQQSSLILPTCAFRSSVRIVRFSEPNSRWPATSAAGNVATDQGSSPRIKLTIRPQRFSEFFRHESDQATRLTHVQRSALITLHSLGLDRNLIQQLTGCDPETIIHWTSQFEQHGSLEDQPRSGRPLLSDAKTDESNVQFAQSTPFTTPKNHQT